MSIHLHCPPVLPDIAGGRTHTRADGTGTSTVNTGVGRKRIGASFDTWPLAYPPAARVGWPPLGHVATLRGAAGHCRSGNRPPNDTRPAHELQSTERKRPAALSKQRSPKRPRSGGEKAGSQIAQEHVRLHPLSPLGVVFCAPPREGVDSPCARVVSTRTLVHIFMA